MATTSYGSASGIGTPSGPSPYAHITQSTYANARNEGSANISSSTQPVAFASMRLASARSPSLSRYQSNQSYIGGMTTPPMGTPRGRGIGGAYPLSGGSGVYPAKNANLTGSSGGYQQYQHMLQNSEGGGSGVYPAKRSGTPLTGRPQSGEGSGVYPVNRSPTPLTGRPHSTEGSGVYTVNRSPTPLAGRPQSTEGSGMYAVNRSPTPLTDRPQSTEGIGIYAVNRGPTPLTGRQQSTDKTSQEGDKTVRVPLLQFAGGSLSNDTLPPPSSARSQSHNMYDPVASIGPLKLVAEPGRQVQIGQVAKQKLTCEPSPRTCAPSPCLTLPFLQHTGGAARVLVEPPRVEVVLQAAAASPKNQDDAADGVSPGGDGDSEFHPFDSHASVEVQSLTAEQYQAYQELDQVEMDAKVRCLEVTLEEERREKKKLRDTFAMELMAEQDSHQRDMKVLEDIVAKVVAENRELRDTVAKLSASGGTDAEVVHGSTTRSVNSASTETSEQDPPHTMVWDVPKEVASTNECLLSILKQSRAPFPTMLGKYDYNDGTGTTTTPSSVLKFPSNNGTGATNTPSSVLKFPREDSFEQDRPLVDCGGDAVKHRQHQPGNAPVAFVG